MKRQMAFKALVGSANYNLTTLESDKDYKVFVIPTFSDLYKGTVFTESITGNMIDEEYHDIRRLVNLFWKSNVNFVEVLYSTDMIINKHTSIRKYIEKILSLRDEIARMNLPYLYKACKGMYLSKSKYIETGNVKTRYLVAKYGYDSKSAMHAFRILDFVERFSKNEFTNFKAAIHYDETGRNFMLNIKNGVYSKNQYDDLINNKLTTFKELESRYMERPIKETVKETLENLLYKMVMENVSLELSEE